MEESAILTNAEEMRPTPMIEGWKPHIPQAELQEQLWLALIPARPLPLLEFLPLWVTTMRLKVLSNVPEKTDNWKLREASLWRDLRGMLDEAISKQEFGVIDEFAKAWSSCGKARRWQDAMLMLNPLPDEIPQRRHWEDNEGALRWKELAEKVPHVDIANVRAHRNKGTPSADTSKTRSRAREDFAIIRSLLVPDHNPRARILVRILYGIMELQQQLWGEAQENGEMICRAPTLDEIFEWTKTGVVSEIKPDSTADELKKQGAVGLTKGDLKKTLKPTGLLDKLSEFGLLKF